MAPIVSVLLLFAGFIHSTLANVLPQCSHRAINELIPPTATINYVRYVPRNSSFGDAAALGNETGLPEGCAIGINVLSSNTSSYNFALFLPNIWNSRFLATGNGGYGGFTNWVYMGMFSQYGFATLSADTGHISGIGDTSWALNAPERVVDWGYRAMHGSVDLGKKVVQAYYGNRINYSYYAACSTGGRQGLKEVQEYPEDFDGVLVAAPAWLLTRLPALAIQLANLNLPSDDPKHIPADMFSTITSEILKQCDGQDGVGRFDNHGSRKLSIQARITSLYNKEQRGRLPHSTTAEDALSFAGRRNPS
ncbi:tannase and feruloyl esterase [Neofusicoccum parvum]|nr:tannase and feruloyl esterase [Neofusicoccum parvum]